MDLNPWLLHVRGILLADKAYTLIDIGLGACPLPEPSGLLCGPLVWPSPEPWFWCEWPQGTRDGQGNQQAGLVIGMNAL